MHPFCNLQSRARTHAVLMIGLYELLGNPTTYLIEPPGPLSEARCTQYRRDLLDTVRVHEIAYDFGGPSEENVSQFSNAKCQSCGIP